MRAPGHPQGSFITEIMMDELADTVKMDPVEFRIKNLPPEAPNAMWRSLPARGRRGVRLGQAASDRRHDARPDQDRHGRRDQHVGRRRPRPVAGALRDRVGRQRRRARRHAGPRHRHAHAGRDRRRRRARPAAVADHAGDRRHACTASAADRAAARPPASISPGDPHRRASTRSTRSRRRSRRRSASSRRRWSRPAAASTSRTTRRRACRGPTPASRSARSRSPPTATGSPACRRSRRRGVQFAEVTVDIETGIVKVTRVLAIQDCGLVVSRLTAESQVLRRRHRLAELRAVRGSHPRSQHRADGQPEHGVVPARRACPTSRRSTFG